MNEELANYIRNYISSSGGSVLYTDLLNNAPPQFRSAFAKTLAGLVANGEVRKQVARNNGVLEHTVHAI